jgi:hypothetical protein
MLLHKRPYLVRDIGSVFGNLGAVLASGSDALQ